MWTTAGVLEVVPVDERLDLVAPAVAEALSSLSEADLARVGVAAIDPALADTAAFCERYGAPMEWSANCVVVSGRREGEARFAAALVLATTRADVNGLIRRRLDVRKASFAPMDEAVALTGMEFGGITPIGLPSGWPVLVDAAVAEAAEVVIGSGIRASKLFVPGEVLAALPGAEVVEDLGPVS